MESINDRIKSLIYELGLTPNSFAKKIGKAQSSVAVIVDGRSKPGFEFLELICLSFPQVSRDWLLAGEGKIFREKSILSPDNYLQEHLNALEENFNKLLDQLSVKDHQLESKDQQIAGLQRMLEAFVGKPSGVPRRPSRTIPLAKNTTTGAYALSGIN